MDTEEYEKMLNEMVDDLPGGFLSGNKALDDFLELKGRPKGWIHPKSNGFSIFIPE